MGLLFSGCKEKPPPKPPLQVQVVTVTPQDVPIYQQWIGTLDGYPNAQIRAQVSGYLIRQDYAEGGAVKKGDLLFEMDPRPFQAALDQALGKLAQDQAQYGKTELDVKRYTPLARDQAISQEELDDADPGQPRGQGGHPVRQGRRGKRHAEPRVSAKSPRPLTASPEPPRRKSETWSGRAARC